MPDASEAPTETEPETDQPERKVIRKKALLPKGEEGALIEVMRQLSRDVRKLCDYMLTCNAEDEFRATQEAEQKKMMADILAKLSVVEKAVSESQTNKKMLTHVLAMNDMLVNAQATTWRDIVKWALWITTCALLGAGMIKIYTGWPG